MTARIEEIRIQNFRALENVRLTLSDLTFLVGRNGAGKSSILDAIEFIREALTDNLPNALNRRDGLRQLRRFSAPLDEPLGIAVLFHLPVGSRSIRVLYGFRIYVRDRGSEIHEALHLPDLDPVAQGTEEQRSRRREGYWRGPNGFLSDVNISPGMQHDRLMLPVVAGASQLWSMAWDTLSRVRGYELSPYMMASPSPIGPRTTLDRNGANVGDVVNNLLERPEDHAWVNRYISGVTDGIEAVHVRAERGFRVLEFTQRTGAGAHQILSAGQVSQGTLRALGILLALSQAPAPSLLVLDEIEDSIHPLAVDVLLEAVERYHERFPIVVTTHSPEVLGRKLATGERIRALQWHAGQSRVYRLSTGTLAQLDPVTTVGWLLSINGLGISEPGETWSGDFLEWA